MPDKITVPSTFAAWSELEPLEWRSAVWAVVDQLYPHAPEVLAAEAQRQELFATALDPVLRDDLDGSVREVINSASQAAAVLGFALARTWPAQPEDLPAWAERAWDYAALHRPILTREDAITRGVLPRGTRETARFAAAIARDDEDEQALLSMEDSGPPDAA